MTSFFLQVESSVPSSHINYAINCLERKLHGGKTKSAWFSMAPMHLAQGLAHGDDEPSWFAYDCSGLNTKCPVSWHIPYNQIKEKGWSP